MDSDPKKLADEARHSKARPVVSSILQDGTLLETLLRPEERRTLFCLEREGQIRYEENLLVDGERLVPYSPHNNLLRHDVVLLPSEPEEYGTEEELLADIRAFIHRYVDLSPAFETLTTYYVLLTWVYDAFAELPYLRVRGDYGSGKTRFLLTVGSLCYKPIFASGASTVSPLFRILDEFRGTLLIDEADFRLSDEKAEVVKILNNGHARGFPVLRSEATPSREFNPRAYAVFGPKLVATRGAFEDRALESRCLTEELGRGPLREGIPLNLPTSHREEALHLRNRLLLFRLRSFTKVGVNLAPSDPSLEPRLNQILIPLLSVVSDETARQELLALARDYQRAQVSERGADTDGQVLEVIRDLIAAGEERLSVKEITRSFVERHGEEYERKVTAKYLGGIIRRRLHLRTRKSHGVFVIPPEEMPAVRWLFEKYGVPAPGTGTGDTPGSVSGGLV